MKDNLGTILIIGICSLFSFVGGLTVKTKLIEPRNATKMAYKPKQMTCVEFDSNDIIFHGPVKITFLDPNQFKYGRQKK